MEKFHSSRRIPWVFFIIAQFLLIGVAFTSGFLIHSWFFDQGKFPLFDEAYQLLMKNTIDEIPTTNDLQHGMIKGLVQTLKDPYTTFVEPAQHEIQTNQLSGKFGGIGVRVERDQQKNLRIYPYQGSPAEQAGIKDGDILIGVESTAITPEMKIEEIQALIRGPVGEKVKILIYRSDNKSSTSILIQRAEYAIPSVTWNSLPEDPQVGVFHVSLIAGTTPDEVRKAIADLQSKGVTYFVMDLRNNSGGLVDSGVNLSKLFLKSGLVIQQQYKNKPIQSFEVTKEGEFSDLPLVILVNNGTASAAEIVAGALKVQNRALLIGQKTYGKQTIQLIFELKDGSSLHVTSARWWVPGIEQNAIKGLNPDIAISQDEKDENAYYSAAIKSLVK